jgi:hypothetical protein
MSRDTNAKTEFLETVSTKKVLCAEITYYPNSLWGEEEQPMEHFIATLPVNHTEDEYEEFIDSLDFDYDSGYGGQELFGTIWMQDGTWFTRGEYDGSEWWQHHSCPEIPENLKP